MTQLRASVAIVGGRVIPGAGEPIENCTVLVTDGVITAVGPEWSTRISVTRFSSVPTSP